MKSVQRFNRVDHKRKPRSSVLLPTALVLGAGALVLELGFVGVLTTAAGFGAYNYYTSTSRQGLARLRQAHTMHDVVPTRILDRYGRTLLEISDTSQGLHRNVPLSKVPTYMKEAIIATENKTFYSDPGFDPARMASALLYDLRYHGTYQGASTITQQVVKKLVLNDQQTFQRKLQEIMIAYATTRPGSGFNKNDILSLYLNSVFFGHQAYGIEAAARVFFGKHIWQLDLAQCALLAGLVQAPSLYDPLGPDGPQAAKDRMHDVLGRMLAEGYVTQAQVHSATREGDAFVFSIPRWRLTTSKSSAPYWTDWIQHLLTYGSAADVNAGWYTDPTLAAIVAKAGGLTSGLTIQTTLDLDMYNQAQQIMNQRVAELAGHNVTDSAVVAIDPYSSECLAMVGGLDYNSPASGSQINMAAAPRQPGSSFKLFTYLTAFAHGYYPAKVILDEPQTWPDSSEPGGVYAPTDYDFTWHGAVTVRIALANSYNMPAVKTIADVGVQPVVNTAEEMGLTYLKGQNAGLSLTLGANPVPLWQMAQAYNIVANGGVFRPMASILSIKNSDGNTLWTYHRPRGVQVVAPQYSYIITSILKDNHARVLAFGPNSQLQLDRPAAVKTGTSQQFKDNLTIGYAPNLLTAVWVGNTDDSAMDNIEGVDGAGPIWHDFMEYGFQHLNLPVQDFTPPPGVVMARVSSSGYLAGYKTAWAITDLFAAGTLPHEYDPGYGENYLRYRHYYMDFSVDGGTTGATYNGVTAPIPISGTTPLSGSVPSGTSGLLAQRPASNADLCGGRYYTYSSVYVNGQLMWRYVCQ